MTTQNLEARLQRASFILALLETSAEAGVPIKRETVIKLADSLFMGEGKSFRLPQQENVEFHVHLEAESFQTETILNHRMSPTDYKIDTMWPVIGGKFKMSREHRYKLPNVGEMGLSLPCEGFDPIKEYVSVVLRRERNGEDYKETTFIHLYRPTSADFVVSQILKDLGIPTE
jgi:hypothetical protein